MKLINNKIYFLFRAKEVVTVGQNEMEAKDVEEGGKEKEREIGNLTGEGAREVVGVEKMMTGDHTHHQINGMLQGVCIGLIYFYKFYFTFV